MQPVSDEFNDAVRGGGSPLVTVTVGDTTLDVIDGSVTLDSTATTRAACSLTVAVSQDDLEFGGLIPDNPDDLLAPYGNEITIRRGLLINGEPEMVQLGIFRIDEVEASETNDGQVQLTLSGMDRSMVLIDAVFETAGQLANGTIASQALVLLAYQGYGGLLEISDAFGQAPLTKVPLVGWEAGDDRWDFLTGLAEAINGSELFFDQDGILTMIDRAAQEQPPAVWDFVEGDDATLLGVSKRWSREDAVNRVIVEGSNSQGDDIVRGEARDLNPFSPTFYSSSPGRFGKKTMVWSSDWVQYQTQADAVAARILRQNVGTHQEIGFDALVHPAFEPNDVVTLRRPQMGINEDHIIESVTIPLALDGTMSVTTRRYQVTGDATPPPPLPSGTLARAITDTASITDARSLNYKPGGVAPALPPAGMTLKWSAAIGVVAGEPIAPTSAGGDWDQMLNETTGPDPVSRAGYVEITAPPTEVAGHRNELMSSNDARGGMLVGNTYYIEWEVFIPSTVVIPNDDDDYSTINQMKGRNDNNPDAHYTGGVGIRTDERFEVRVRGGNYVGPGNIYQGMNDTTFGNLIRDHWHKIGYHVKWAWSGGFAKVYLDGVLGANFPNVPTMSVYSNGLNFRLGWYPERVGPGSVVMRIRNVKIYQ